MQGARVLQSLLSGCVMLVSATHLPAGGERNLYDKAQYEMLVRCSREERAEEWNRWREANTDEVVSLQGADLTDMRLDGFNLAHANLRGAILDKAHLYEASLAGANMRDASLSQTQFGHTNLTEASLQNASGVGPHFEGADLTSADLQDAELEPSYFDGALLRRSKLKGSQLKNARMDGIRLFDTDLSGVSLDGATLRRANLAGADLTGARLNNVDLSYATIADANMTGTALTGVQFAGAQIFKSNLRRADLRRSILTQTVFAETHLGHTNFGMAVVDGFTCFLDCQLDEGTDFRGVGLGNARIRESERTFLERNIRRLNWEAWNEGHPLQRLPVKLFWWISDYGAFLYLLFSLLSPLACGVRLRLRESSKIRRRRSASPRLGDTTSFEFSARYISPWLL
jgi:uncharacterized protein YjbI with pentapeptide repeats